MSNANASFWRRGPQLRPRWLARFLWLSGIVGRFTALGAGNIVLFILADTLTAGEPDPGWAIFFGVYGGLLQAGVVFIWGVHEGSRLISFTLSAIRWGITTVAVAFASPLSTVVLGQRESYFWTDYGNDVQFGVVTILIAAVGGHLIGRVFVKAYDTPPAVRKRGRSSDM